MSCPAANSIVRMDVTMGSLPDGFCPATLKELAEAIAARLIVTPNQANSSFASGPIEPSSNQGPWFKNCEELFVFNDATASYRPITKGGFNKNQVFDSSGTFTVPDNIYFIMVEAWGAGGGGANNSAGNQHGGGGGSGAYGNQFFNVTPAQAFVVSVGTGGANGVSGTAGGASTFSTLTAGGGTGATADVGNAWSDGGKGGTVTGANFGIAGSAGHGASSGTTVGHGGSAPNGGPGGQAHLTADGGVAIMNGVQPGGGGGGGVNAAAAAGTLPPNGGTGGNGRIIVWW